MVLPAYSEQIGSWIPRAMIASELVRTVKHERVESHATSVGWPSMEASHTKRTDSTSC